MTDNPLDNPGDNAYIRTELEHIEADIVNCVHRVQELQQALTNLLRTLPEAEARECSPPAFIKRRKGIQ